MAIFEINNKRYNCPVELVVDTIGGKWKSLILWHLRNDILRYGELKNALINVTHKMLSQCLKELESDGLIQRKVYEIIPPKVEYSLSAKGKKLIPALEIFQKWGMRYKLKK